MDKLFGHEILKNSFLKHFSSLQITELLDQSLLINLSAGEHIYKHDQIASHGILRLTAVYLIISGRVNCLQGRNICFKNYVQGSYFGDIEYLAELRRLFSIRAEEPTVLLAIPAEALTRVYKENPDSHLIQWRISLKRYLCFKACIKKASAFQKITNNDEWWDQPNTTDVEINKRFESWLYDVAKIHMLRSPAELDRSRYIHLTPETLLASSLMYR